MYIYIYIRYSKEFCQLTNWLNQKHDGKLLEKSSNGCFPMIFRAGFHGGRLRSAHSTHSTPRSGVNF